MIKRIVAGILVVASVSLFSAKAEDLGGLEKDMTFYCSYDNGVNADSCAGKGDAEYKAKPEFMEGVLGKAVVVGGDPGKNQVSYFYSPENNFNIYKGGLSLWMKPLDWDGGNDKFHVIFRDFSGKNFFQIYKFFSHEHFQFLYGEQGRSWAIAKTKCGDWKPGEWFHLFVNWNQNEIKLFINGKIMAYSRVKVPIINTTPQEKFSVGPGTWGDGSYGKSLVDEVRIFNRPLTQSEVFKIYQKDAATVKLNSGFITMSKKTPKLDGKIEDKEYAFTGTGLLNVKNIMYSKEQGFYSLSYDDKNLYIAFDSNATDDGKNEPQKDGNYENVERVELFLDEINNSSYHIVFSKNGNIYDAKDNSSEWNADGIHVKNAVNDGRWVMEAVIPFAAFGLQKAPEGESCRLNIGRVFNNPLHSESVAPVVGRLNDKSKFMVLKFDETAPILSLRNGYDLTKNRATLEKNTAFTEDKNATINMIITQDTTLPYGFRSRKKCIFKDGKPVAQNLRDWRMLDFNSASLTIEEEKDGKTRKLYHRKQIVQRNVPMKVVFLYTKSRKNLSVTALQRAEGKIQMRFTTPEKVCAFKSINDIPKDSSYFESIFPLDFTKLAPNNYMVHVDFVSPDGKEVEVHCQPYGVPSVDTPILKKYVDPEAGTVPAPWTNVQTNGAIVKIWNRQYDFSNGMLFSSLLTNGQEVLAGPTTFTLNGKPLNPEGGCVPVLISQDNMKATYEKNTDLGPLKVNSEITAHFDGYCEVNLTVNPSNVEQKIKTLSLDIPLKGDVAQIVRDNRLSKLMGGKSGAIGDYWCQDIIQKDSFLWVGNNRIGFNAMFKSTDNWNIRDYGKTVELIKNGDIVTLRFNIVDFPITLDKPWSTTFGFCLTPTRPLNKKILRQRLQKDWEQWCQPWRYFAVPEYDEADVDLIKYRSRNVDEIFIYLGESLTSPFSPEWAFWEEEWRGPRNGTIEYGRITNGEKMTILEPDSKYRYRLGYCSGNIAVDTFRNYVLHTRKAFFDKAKTPLTPKAINYYFDTGVGSMANVDYVRELVLNAYRMIKRTGPNAKIMVHQGWYRFMPTQHFADAIIGGEGVESTVGNQGSYYDVLNPEMFRATFSPYIWGMKTAFLSMIVRGVASSPERLANFNKDPKIRHAVKHAYGYGIVHDADIWASHKETLWARQTMWAAQDVIGWDENVKYFPYYDNDAVKLISPVSSRIMASAYSNNGKLLLAILNDTPDDQDISLSLDLAKLGVEVGLKGTEAWEKEKDYVLSSKFNEKIPARGFLLIPFDKK